MRICHLYCKPFNNYVLSCQIFDEYYLKLFPKVNCLQRFNFKVYIGFKDRIILVKSNFIIIENQVVIVMGKILYVP